jgi:hypothetical protein
MILEMQEDWVEKNYNLSQKCHPSEAPRFGVSGVKDL